MSPETPLRCPAPPHHESPTTLRTGRGVEPRSPRPPPMLGLPDPQSAEMS